jgi:hypothetical protein
LLGDETVATDRRQAAAVLVAVKVVAHLGDGGAFFIAGETLVLEENESCSTTTAAGWRFSRTATSLVLHDGRLRAVKGLTGFAQYAYIHRMSTDDLGLARCKVLCKRRARAAVQRETGFGNSRFAECAGNLLQGCWAALKHREQIVLTDARLLTPSHSLT